LTLSPQRITQPLVAMRTMLAFILLPFLSIGQAVDTVDYKTIELKDDGLSYKRGSDKPFTGAVAYHKGSKSGIANFKDGKKEGLETMWLKNGKKWKENNYTDGKLEHTIEFYGNGKKLRENNYKDGKKEGVQTSWYTSGHKRKEEYYINGKSGRWVYYYRNGQKGTEYDPNDLMPAKHWDKYGNRLPNK